MTTLGVPATSTLGPSRWRTATPVAARWGRVLPSVVLAVLVGAFLLASPALSDITFGDTTWTSVGTQRWWASPYMAASLVVVVTGVLLGRRHPVWATLLVVAPLAGYPWAGWWAYGWWLGLVAVVALAALDGVRRAVVPALAAVGVMVWFCGAQVLASVPVGVTDSGSGSGFSLAVLVVHVVALVAVTSVAAAVGSASRSRLRGRDAALVEQRALQVESVAAERARLARDLHDVVAHHVSLVAVRAESAPYQYPDLDPDAREVLAAIATDARQALGELRHVLTVLRRTDDGPERAPQPGARDVDDLVTAARDAGQEVSVVGEWHDVEPSTGYVLFRVAQECLTNGRRHAPTHPVTVERWRDDDVRVGLRVSNTVDGDPDREVVPGRGLHGMRERVEALGGTLTARVTGGRFVVEARLPGVRA